MSKVKSSKSESSNVIFPSFEIEGNSRRIISEKPDSDLNGRKRFVSSQHGSPVVNPHNYHMMMSNSKICGRSQEERVNLLILVASAADHFQQRDSIRETWGRKSALRARGVRLVFLLANPNNLKIQRDIVEEYRSQGDLLQEDFQDSYMNLTLKSVMGIRWASKHCSQAKFVMKTDDDIYVNVPLLLQGLERLPGRRLFTGCIKQIKSFRPVNISPGVSLPPAHPPFVAGAGYVFSGSLLKDLLDASLRRPLLPIEDVYVTAHLARMVGAHPPLHDARFSCGEMVRRDCHLLSAFTGHKIDPERMRAIHQTLSDPVSSCGMDASNQSWA